MKEERIAEIKARLAGCRQPSEAAAEDIITGQGKT